jgi:hypothetical protein
MITVRFDSHVDRSLGRPDCWRNIFITLNDPPGQFLKTCDVFKSTINFALYLRIHVPAQPVIARTHR